MRGASTRSGLRRSWFGELAMSVGAVLVLLTVLIGLDGRVRDVLSLGGGAGRPGDRVVEAGGWARDLAIAVLDAARDQSLDHAPLMIFVLAATILVLIMFRT